MAYCSNCGTEISDGAKFCPKCGAELNERVTKICRNCGNECKGTEKFCSVCGTPFEGEQPLQQITQSTPSYEDINDSPSKMKNIIPIIIVLIALVLIGGGWLYYNSSNTQAVNDTTKDTSEKVDVTADDSLNKQIEEIYSNLISEKNADLYYLADISGDGHPELFLKKCSDVTCSVNIYTVHNGITIHLLDIGGGGDSNIFIGKNYIIELSAGENYCVWRKYEFKKYEQLSMKENIIYKNYLDDDVNFYKEPTEPLIKWIDAVTKETVERSHSSTTESVHQQVDIMPILNECQNEITAIQREIEDACRTFAVLGSQDVDMYKYTQMKSTFLDGVSNLERKADKAFDKCARELQEAGYPDAVEKINEEKRNFHSAIYGLTTRTTQQVDMSY